MRPLIKWPGGKSTEIKFIKSLIPHFKRYIEPFFGGGALFFHLKPNQGIINDIVPELITFYRFIKNQNVIFQKELNDYVDNWENIGKFVKEIDQSIMQRYIYYRKDKITLEELQSNINRILQKGFQNSDGLFHNDFCVDSRDLQQSIGKNTISKLERIKLKIEKNKIFTDIEIKKNIETAFKSGFYIHFRNILNLANNDTTIVSEEKKIANYYFIREFCFGGMFRYNSEGNFNIPYGGMLYNKKNFRRKVDYLFSDSVSNLLQNTTIENNDFQVFMEKHSFSKTDFIFFDPPYDTEFSDYEENSFTRKDQERLSSEIMKLDAKFILIIKDTPFIRQLYENNNQIKIQSFDKTYAYNVKGRNIRDVQHLVIHNLKETQQTLLDHFS